MGPRVGFRVCKGQDRHRATIGTLECLRTFELNRFLPKSGLCIAERWPETRGSPPPLPNTRRALKCTELKRILERDRCSKGRHPQCSPTGMRKSSVLVSGRRSTKSGCLQGACLGAVYGLRLEKWTGLRSFRSDAHLVDSFSEEQKSFLCSEALDASF